MKDQFKRIIDFVRKTGDTMVVTDTNGEDVYVVMDLDNYELLIDSLDNYEIEDFDEDDDYESERANDFNVEEDLAENVSETTQSVPKEQSVPAIWDSMQSATDKGQTWDISKLNEKEMADLEEKFEEFAARNVKEAIEETANITDVNDFDEEEFYLEPIE